MDEQLIIKHKKLVITNDNKFVEQLEDKGIIKDGEYKVLSSPQITDVDNKDVIWNAPFEVASYAKSVCDGTNTFTVRDINSTDGLDYYIRILEGYNDEEYELAYKYYLHNEVSTKNWKDYDEISKARTIYFDIMNAFYGQFDIYTIENKGWREFIIVSCKLDDLSVSLVYEDETETENIKLQNFNRASVLKFVNDLMTMCL